jgi:hypothetical protein
MNRGIRGWKLLLSSLEEEEDLMDSISVLSKNSDMDEDGQGWQASKSKRERKAKKRKVVVASRTSSRIARDGIPIADKASALARRRDNIQGIISDNPFTVLHSMPVSVMQSILVDLDIEVEDVDEQLGAFKTEELARAAIAKANYKNYLDKQKEKSAP